ncbi:MAG: pentapeptide repeat-containing protein [Parvularcula sp.]
MRQLIFLGGFAWVVLTTWYNYATPVQREVLPAQLQKLVVASNAAFTRGIAETSRLAEGAFANHTPPSTEFDTVTATPSDGIDRVYEIPASSTGQPASEILLLGAELAGSNFSDAQLSHAALDGANMSRASFVEANLEQASARLATFQEAMFHRTDLSSANMQGSNFSNTIFVETVLSGAHLQKSTLDGVLIRNTKSIATNFDQSSLQFAIVETSDLRRSSFLGANLRQSRFVDVQLHGARFDGANLSGADLSRTTGLTQAALTGACGDATTYLPKGVSVRPCRADPTIMAEESAPHSARQPAIGNRASPR